MRLPGRMTYLWAAPIVVAALYLSCQIAWASQRKLGPAWQYRTLATPPEAPDEALDALGRQGWELIGVTSRNDQMIHYVFKRPAP